jgi:hypothetical protein
MRKNLTPTDLLLIAALLVPVYGVLFLEWEPRKIFFIYCLESLLIGLFTLIKMGITTSVKKKDIWENNGSKTMMHGSFFMLFFFVHYGFFMAIQIFIFSKTMSLNGKEMTITDFLLHWPAYIGNEGYIALGIFVLAYGAKQMTEFVLSGQYKTVSLSSIMFEPYLRVFIQQFTVILGSFFLLFNAGKLFILVFALARIAFEVLLQYDVKIKEALSNLNQERSSSHS